MVCPKCNSNSVVLVCNKIEYKFEPNYEITFLNGKSFHHEHDFNPRTSIWKCSNGHEYEISVLKPCIACNEQKQYESFLERIKPISSSDSCPLIFSNSFQPPPEIM